MKVSCEILIVFDSKIKAETVLKSIEVDNFNYVKSELKDNSLKSEIKARSISSLLHTIDDYLACLNVAEKIVDKDK